jgi:hypothetical protein
MFVVGTVQRVADASDASKFTLVWPVVVEDETQGFVGGQVATRKDRDSAQKLADDLNKVLTTDQ